MLTLGWIALGACILAMGFVLTSPSADVTSTELKRFPELTRFPNEAEASRALRRAYGGMLGARVVAFLFVGVPVWAGLGFCHSYLCNLLLRVVSGQWVYEAQNLIGFIILSTIGSAAVTYALTRRVKASLRQQLAHLGIPICIGCGYDLTGNTSGVCPECGLEP